MLCKNLDELSAAGKWDDVFECLQLDANSTIELGALRSHKDDEYLWLKKHKADLNSLEIILAIILIFDQIFYVILIWYLGLFAYKFVRHHIRQRAKMLEAAKKDKESDLNQGQSEGAECQIKR